MGKVTVAVRSDTETPVDDLKSAPARSKSMKKLVCTGDTLSSSTSSKVTVSVAPFITARTTAGGVVSGGGVLLVTGCQEKLGAALPLRSRTRGCPGAGEYRTLTLWSWVTGVARVPVTVRPTTSCTLPLAKGRSDPTRTTKVPTGGIESSFSASSNVTVTASPFTAALTNAGPVVSSGV